MKKNLAGQTIAAQMNSRNDGSPLTSGVSIVVTLDSLTQAAGAGTLAHEGGGHWSYGPTQAETDGNHIAYQFNHATGVNQLVQVYTSQLVPGVQLVAEGLDLIFPEPSLAANLRQMIAIFAAVLSGRSAGGTTDTITFKAMGSPTLIRVTAAVSADQNRMDLAFVLPA